MKHVDLTVCQGIGDIFWVYQQFAPHVDRITFIVAHTQGGSVAHMTRARPFLELLPKVDGVFGTVVTIDEYNAIASGRFDMGKILAAGHGAYSCNLALEDGRRIETIEPAFPIEETVRIATRPFETPRKFVLLYVSESTMQETTVQRCSLWRPPQWAQFVRGVYARLPKPLPLIIIGAGYDAAAARAVAAELPALEPVVLIDLLAPHVCYLLSRCHCFIGYQSGLNVLADQFDRPQAMLYFPHLERMQYSWCKRANAKTLFHAGLFSQTPMELLRGLPPRWPTMTM